MKVRRDDRELRNFGILVGGILLAIGTWPAVIHAEGVRCWVLIPGGFLVGLGAAAPRLLAGILDIWMKIGHWLGWVNTRIIFGILFYGLITPVGLLMRLLGRDPMRRWAGAELDTYRIVREPRAATHLKHQF